MRKIIVLGALGAVLAGCATPQPDTGRTANIAAIRAAEPVYQGRLKLCMQRPEPPKVIDCVIAVERANYADIGINKPAALEAYLTNLRSLLSDAVTKPRNDQVSFTRGAQLRAGYLANLANSNF